MLALVLPVAVLTVILVVVAKVRVLRIRRMQREQDNLAETIKVVSELDLPSAATVLRQAGFEYNPGSPTEIGGFVVPKVFWNCSSAPTLKARALLSLANWAIKEKSVDTNILFKHLRGLFESQRSELKLWRAIPIAMAFGALADRSPVWRGIMD